MSRTPARAARALICLAMGCGTDAPPPPQSKAVAVQAPSELAGAQRVVVPRESGAVLDPVYPAELLALYPEIAALPNAQQQIAVAALNLVPGPCAPCAEAGEHLARCALRTPTPACANVPGLVGRAASGAGAGVALKGVMESVHYPDIWLPLPTEGPGVPVYLVLEPESAWAREGRSTEAALRARYGSRVRVTEHRLDSELARTLAVRTTPAWAVAGYRMRGAQSPNALARLIERELGPGVSE